MQPDQQQRIMGYFIEEAKDHLNTIEQGLLNLQSTIEDSEMVNEVFRAAHSVKGGAAMLGLNSIQRVSHRLEDFFKVLKETPVRVDQKLENLFLRAFDALQELLGQLQGPFGLTDDAANNIVAGVEPTFEELEQHLNKLAGGAGLPQLSIPVTSGLNLDDELETSIQVDALQQIFRNDVPTRLRDMLQLFKQPETDPVTRQQLQELCRSLSSIGEQHGLTTWCHLIETARRAITHSDNSYRTLAPIVIRDIKLGQELVLAGRTDEIVPCAQLQALVPIAVATNETTIQDDFTDLLAGIGEDSLLHSATASNEPGLEELAAAASNLDLTGEFDASLGSEDLETHQGPEVGTAELNSLADLFEGEVPDLGLTWQQEEVIRESADLETAETGLGDLDDSGDFSDLLLEESSPPTTGFGESDDFSDLFGGELFEESSPETSSPDSDAVDANIALDDFEDLLEISDSTAFASGTNADLDLDMIADELPGFDDVLTDDVNLSEFGSLSLQHPTDASRTKGVELDSTLNDLGDLFDGLNEGDLASTQLQELSLDTTVPDPWSEENTTETTAASLEDLALEDLHLADAASIQLSDVEPIDELAEPDATSLDLDLSDFLSVESGDELSGEAPANLDLNFENFPAIDPLDEPEGLEFLSGDASDNSLDDLLASTDSSNLSDSMGLPDAGIPALDNESLDATADDLPSFDTLGAEADLSRSQPEGIPDPWGDYPELPQPELDLTATETQSLENLLTESEELANSAELLGTGNTELFNSESLHALELDASTIPNLHAEHSADEEYLFQSEGLGELEDSLSSEPLEFETGDELTSFLEQDSLNFDAELVEPTSSLLDSMDVPSCEEPLQSSDFDELLEIDDASTEIADESVPTEELIESGSFELEDSSLLSKSFESEAPSIDQNELLDDALLVPEISPTSGSEETVNADGLSLSNELDLTEIGDFEIPDLPADDSFDLIDLSTTDAEQATDRFGDLDALLDEAPELVESDAIHDLPNAVAEESSVDDEAFAELDGLLDQPSPSDFSYLNNLDELLDTTTTSTELETVSEPEVSNDLSDLETLLDEDNSPDVTTSSFGDFSDLEALLDTDASEDQPVDVATSGDSEFDDLDDLLKDAEEKMGGSPSVKIGRGVVPPARRTTRPGRVFSEQTMRVPVKHLDNLSNLVGELVVNRNSLEQDQERLRQSLDNLLYQVQQLSDVGQRMQDLYERSLLESSLLASRQGYRISAMPIGSRETTVIEPEVGESPGIEYDPLEMDRFTGFHSLSQEMIELIVRVRESSSDIEFIVDETEQVTRMFRQVTTQLQEGLTRSRMVPFAQTADRLPRAVRDISMKVGKQAELVIEGRETLIDKMILEQLYDPMTHLVNNAITHGIEPPAVRAALGKPPAGRITIRAFHQGNQTIISVSDDGAGIDVERVKAKAIEKGLITAADAQVMSRLDVYDILFHPGFSTKDQADDFSGRGVGMDVVRTSLSEIRGVINTDSNPAKGTTFTIRLPLTLSISKALCCISDRARIAFPMDGVEDMIDVPKERIQTNSEGQPCIAWRDTILPVRPLPELLGYNRHLSRGNVYGGNQEDDIISIVVLRSAGNFLALQVDQVLGEQEIVIKQLEGPVPKPVGVAGATVLGDGRIMPIADVLELIDLSMGRIRRDAGGSLWEQSGLTALQEPPATKTEPMVLIVDDSITVRELLSMTFNKVGYRVEQARDGQEAWEKLRSGLPCDIVFCDIEMPRMDGLELLSRIQKDANLKHLPIAMLTSRGADRHRQMAASLGASGYFTKPYLEEALLYAAQRMLRGERLLNT